MKFFVTVWRIFVSAWKHLTRNVWLSLTTVFVLMLSLLSVNVLLGVNVILNQAVRTLEEKIDVSVYFVQNTPQGVLDEAKFFMASLPQVESAELLTADDALTAFKDRHAQDPKILGALDEVDGNPLGATLIIKAKNPADYPFLLEALKNPQFDFAIESKNYDDHADTIARVRSISESIRFFGMVLVAIFAAFSVLIVFNTIRIAIYTQREEIGVMRLVGASSAYVRWPFVLEGVFLALFAMLLSAGIVFFVVTYLDPHLRPLFDGEDPGLQTYFFANAIRLAATEGGLLSGLIALSSWAAVGKYLKK